MESPIGCCKNYPYNDIQAYSVQSRVPSKCTNLCLYSEWSKIWFRRPIWDRCLHDGRASFLRGRSIQGVLGFSGYTVPTNVVQRSISAKMQETVNQDWWFRATNWYCQTWYCTLSPFVNIKTHDKQWKEQLVEFCHFVQLLSPRHETRVKVGCSLVELASTKECGVASLECQETWNFIFHC